MTPKLIKNFQETISEFLEKGKQKVTPQQFYELFTLVDNSQMNEDMVRYLIAEEQSQDELNLVMTDKKVLIEYLNNFADDQGQPEIDLHRMQKLLPKQPFYSQDYLDKALHINVPFIKKGIKKYQFKIGQKQRKLDSNESQNTMISNVNDTVQKQQSALKQELVVIIDDHFRNLQSNLEQQLSQMNYRLSEMQNSLKL